MKTVLFSYSIKVKIIGLWVIIQEAFLAMKCRSN